MARIARFIRTWANPMTVRDKDGRKVTISFNETVVSDYDYMIQMPGFELFEEEDGGLQVVSFDPDTEKEESWELQSTEDVLEDDDEDIEEIGLSKEEIKYLKGLNNVQWNKLKKDQVEEYLKKANVDYSEVKPERWEYIRFLKRILKEI